MPWAITSTGVDAKEKSHNQQQTHLASSLAVALMALALVDIHDNFGFANSAVDLQACSLCVRKDPQHPIVSATNRALEPSVSHCQHFTTIYLGLQYFLSHFVLPFSFNIRCSKPEKI